MSSRSISLLVLFLSLSYCVSYAPLDRDSGVVDRSDLPLRITHISGHVYLVEDYNYWKTNHVLYVHPEGIVFFDSSWTPKGARQLLRKTAAMTTAHYHSLVLTSFRLYRTGGLQVFYDREIPILMHKHSLRLMKSKWDAMQAKMQASFASWSRRELILPEHVYADRLSLLKGKIQVIYPGPAHSPDNCVVLFPQENILYAASLIAEPLQHLEYVDWDVYPQALSELEKLKFERIIAGHGKALHRRELLDRLQTRIHQKNKEEQSRR